MCQHDLGFHQGRFCQKHLKSHTTKLTSLRLFNITFAIAALLTLWASLVKPLDVSRLHTHCSTQLARLKNLPLENASEQRVSSTERLYHNSQPNGELIVHHLEIVTIHPGHLWVSNQKTQPTDPWDPTCLTLRTPSQPYSDAKSSIESYVRVVIEPTLDKQVVFLGTRIEKHWSSVRRHDPNPCLAPHGMDRGNAFNWQDTRILESGNSQRAREATEAVLSGKHSVNQFRWLRLQHWLTWPIPIYLSIKYYAQRVTTVQRTAKSKMSGLSRDNKGAGCCSCG